MRQELRGRVEELESYPELLSAAEQSLFECQENRQRSERKCSEKSESIRQLRVKVCKRELRVPQNVKCSQIPTSDHLAVVQPHVFVNLFSGPAVTSF